MNIERLGIRLNLDKEKDRKALEFLQGYDKERYKSLNKFLIEIISEYAENYNIEKEQSDFLERVISTIRQELKSNASLTLASLFSQSQPSVQQAVIEESKPDENAATSLEFINGLCGKYFNLFRFCSFLRICFNLSLDNLCLMVDV